MTEEIKMPKIFCPECKDKEMSIKEQDSTRNKGMIEIKYFCDCGCSNLIILNLIKRTREEFVKNKKGDLLDYEEYKIEDGEGENGI